MLSEERGKRCSPLPSCGYSRATPRSATRYLNCRRCQPSQSAGTNLPLPLGPLTASFVSGLQGEVESSCSHTREAMNLFLKCRISRRNRTASLFQHAVSKHDVSPGRSPWYSCPVRDGVRFPLSVPRVNGRRTGCFMHHAEGRVANPEGCPENPLRERLEQVGRHPRRTCRLALRTKDPGGPGSN